MEDEEDSIDGLPVQDPPSEEFSSADLTWTKLRNPEQTTDNVALIPYSRVDDFICGESSNIECPTRFHIERGRRRQPGSLKSYKSDDYMEYRMYWCSFGPENHGEGGDVLPSRKFRLNTRNRAARPQSMRGCSCHFVVKRLYGRPSIALVVYNQRSHVNKSGFVCHGPLDREAIGPRAKTVPYVSSEMQQQTLSLLYLGVPQENIMQKHIESAERYCGGNAKHDDFALEYVKKLEKIVKRSTHELDVDDESSVRLWVERHKKSVFFYQPSSDSGSFIIGIQTEWQLQQVIRFGHQSILAADSTFGINKFKYPLYTLLSFDVRQHPLPVAWVVTRSFSKVDVMNWMKALSDRVLGVEPTWRINGFVVDDAATDTDPIRDVFHCPILFSVWRVRRAWLKNIVKRCQNVEVQREIFKRLGMIMHSICSGDGSDDALGNFIQDFVDQRAFMEYFKTSWLPKLEMWFTTIKNLPLASLESCSAIEAYHSRLKEKLLENSQHSDLHRVDWLVHKLTTDVYSSYWLDRCSDESGVFENVKEDYLSSTSWYRASQIPDSAVALSNHGDLHAEMVSQIDSSQKHTIWNPGSDFAFCDCQHSMLGYICEHVIKVKRFFWSRNREMSSSMSYDSYQQILLSMWRKPEDNSLELDKLIAMTRQMQETVQRLVELNNANGIGKLVDKLSVKWTAKKCRTSFGKRAAAGKILALSPGKKSATTPRRNLKRKKLASLK